MRFFLLFLICFTANSKILNYETTRTKSTAGAGVGSLLMNEATTTNPAPMAFYNMSSLYIEKYSAEHTLSSNSSTFDTDNLAFIASDSSKNLKGSIAYVKSRSGSDFQKQFNLAFASLLSKTSSMGISYRNIQNQYKYKGKIVNKDYKLYTPGIFHSVNSRFNLGIVAIDPFRKNPEFSKVIIGAQYQFLDFISLMLDAGADYGEDLTESSLIRSAIQVRLMSDFYLRFGAYEDKGLLERGSGFGIGWVTPRLVIDFALKNTKVAESEVLQQNAEDVKESSLSLSLRF